MRIIIFLLATLLLSPPAGAQEATCYSPEQIVEKGAQAGLTVVSDMKGDELKAFNDRYEQQFHHKAPDVDRVLVFGNQDPEGQMIWIAPFKDGCLMAKPVPMSRETFDALHQGQPS